MTTQKFLGIYNRVAAHIPVQAPAEIHSEYGNVSAPALLYRLVGVTVQPERVVAELQVPGVTCKAAGASSSAGQCCGPVTPGPIQLV